MSVASRQRGGGSEEPPVEVRVLGPVLVWAEGRQIAVDRPLERAVLVRLGLARGTPVPDQRMAVDLWGDGDLTRPIPRLRVLISRLRAALGGHANAVLRSPAGYRANIVLADLAAAEAAADRMHAARRAGRHEEVRAAAREALSHWRATALADLMAVPFVRAEAARLEEWRLGLTVTGLDAAVALGAEAEVIAELAALVDEHPLHEPLTRLHAIAVYRTGSQADALDRLQRLRRALSDELGVDPAPETAELELRMLNHDPALRTAPARLAPAPEPAGSEYTGALPVPTDSFLGRRRELSAVLGAASRPGLVSVVGPPGSGKSRLALEAARRLVSTGRAVRLVELGPLHRADTVGPAVAAALEVDAPPQGWAAALAPVLRDAVLVLDGAEHVLAAARLTAATLLRLTPGLTVLVTSQRALDQPGEFVIGLGALERPASVELFVDRSVGPLTAAERADLVSVCAAVDWLPLGIELAAGLTRTLTVAQLAQRIDARVRLLVGGPGGRHGSLQAALDWSYELLEPVEQAVLRRISVFAGGFVLEAAEAVVPDDELDRTGVAPALAELVQRSLVAVHIDGAGRRFSLLETVRAYALTKLAAAQEVSLTRARHADWCLELVTTAGADRRFASAGAVAEVFAEWPNLLEALECAPGTAWAPTGLRLATALHEPWLVRSWYREAQRHFRALIDAPGATSAERANALSRHAFHALMTGGLDRAAELLRQAAGLADGLDDEALLLGIRYYQGIVDIERGRLPAAVDALETGERLAERLGDRTRMSAFADARGTAQLFAGAALAALGSYRRALDIDRELGDEHGLARGLSNSAKALLSLGRESEALCAAEESDLYAKRLDDRQILSLNELVRAAVASAAGRLDVAETHCRTAQACLGDDISMADIDLADVLLAKGEMPAARSLLERVYAEAPPGGTQWLAARAISAVLAAADGDRARARHLVDEVGRDYARSGFGWVRYTARLQAVREWLACDEPFAALGGRSGWGHGS
ncbi:hypothetical protein NDR87_22355 [Nocardia sp. CDC159]|uniref:ATPase n=1 Tax=Nocardia pulmonis TaxID=2951408 RepID=A0A9X2IY63_9NOCA|nr:MULTISPECIES: BTAD domain-containing putative transcriptional regulator [Nocardia]MCM6776737.1 hypothetical protein [Nocardia pulmonis]MCM6789114.1 hypothetical protein [Nocardia sp. CDC159]